MTNSSPSGSCNNKCLIAKKLCFLLLRALKIVAVAAVAFVVLVGVAVVLLNRPSVQDRCLAYATQMLQEKLQTKVEIDSVRFGFFRDDVRLYNLRVEDRQRRPMLSLELLNAEISLWPLLSKEVRLEKVGVKGLRAQLFKARPDTAANYQFVLDALKPAKKEDEEDRKEGKKKEKLTFHLNELQAEDVDVAYNDRHFVFGGMNLQKSGGGDIHAELLGSETAWVHIKKRKGVRVDNRLRIGRVVYEEKDGQREVLFDSLHWTTNNHLPHKRTGKPRRGWFDDGHLNVAARMKVSLQHADKDSICGILTECDANDKASGFHITGLDLRFKKKADKVDISNATIRMAHTTLKFGHGQLQLASKKDGRPFRFSTGNITGTTQLRDIAHPFAPVLQNFKEPLRISTKFSGGGESLTFKDVVVKTADNKLAIRADGGVDELKDKYKLNVHFNIHQCVAQGDVKARIINQFSVKKFMMKQLKTLGTLRYRGRLNVKHKRVEVGGSMGSDCGNMQFALLVNALDKYLTGNVKSDEFQLGKAMDRPEWGNIGCKAAFKIDISKERTAQMRRLKGGKLPIGEVDAVVQGVKIKGFRLNDVHADIVSDGAVAEGRLRTEGKLKLAEILCSFSFTNTDEMKKTKIKPGLRFHLFHHRSDEEKAERKKLKTERKEQKAARKEAKRQEREAKKKI